MGALTFNVLSNITRKLQDGQNMPKKLFSDHFTGKMNLVRLVVEY